MKNWTFGMFRELLEILFFIIILIIFRTLEKHFLEYLFLLAGKPESLHINLT